MNVNDVNAFIFTSFNSRQSSKDGLASAIVNQAFGTGPRVKWSDGANRVANAVLPLATEPASVSSFNVNYSDTGLFGFHVVTTTNDAGKVRQKH